MCDLHCMWFIFTTCCYQRNVSNIFVCVELIYLKIIVGPPVNGTWKVGNTLIERCTVCYVNSKLWNGHLYKIRIEFVKKNIKPRNARRPNLFYNVNNDSCEIICTEIHLYIDLWITKNMFRLGSRHHFVEHYDDKN